MLQDDSPGFQNTWAFVDKGMREMRMFSEAKQTVCDNVVGVPETVNECACLVTGCINCESCFGSGRCNYGNCELF